MTSVIRESVTDEPLASATRYASCDDNVFALTQMCSIPIRTTVTNYYIFLHGFSFILVH